MSISNSYPTQKTTLNLDFANSGKLDSRISFSRADTPPTYAAPSAVHYWSNEKHLSSENLIPYSNDLSQSVWTKRNVTVPATNITAPDGTSSASSLLETSATATHDFYEEFSAVSGTSYTFTLYAKANGRDTLHVSPQATSTIASVVFDLTAVTSTVISGSADSHSITAIGSTGWYKLQVTVTATASGTGFLQTYFRVGGLTNYAGDATKGAYIWGCQASSTGGTVLNETSGSIHREYSSTLKSVANAGDPRFEYDPATDGQSEGSGTALGLLIEAQAENLQRYGSAFESWSNASRLTFSSNAAIAPNGLLEADKIVATSVPGSHSLFDSGPSVVSGTTYVGSVYAKDAGQRYLQLAGTGTAFGASQYSNFDLQTGSVHPASGVTASSEAVGNGWYRLQIVITATSTAAGGAYLALSDSTSATRSPSFTGDDYSGVLCWGFQTEVGSSASSLVDTGTGSSQLSRAADSCSVADFGYTGGPVSVIAEASMISPTTETSQKSVFELGDGTSDNRIWVYNNFGKADSLYVRADGVTGMFESGTVATDDDFAVAVRVDTNNAGRSTNAGSVTSDTSVVMPSGLSTLYIGRSKSSSGNQLNGHFKRLSLFNVALSDVELQSLTTI